MQRWNSGLDRELAAATLWTISLAGSTLSLGLSLSGAIPSAGSAPACLVSTLLMALGVVAWWLLETSPRGRTIDPAAHLLLTASAIVAPTLAGFAWNPAGLLFAIVWTVLLPLAAVGGMVTWNALAAGESDLAGGAGWNFTKPNPASAATASPVTSNKSAPHAAQPVLHRPASVPDVPIAGEAGDADVSLQLVRRHDGADDLIEVTCRIHFEAGERQTSLHLPISPAFAVIPEVDCEPLEAQNVELSVGSCYAYGVRIDAKRIGPLDRPLTASIGVQLRALRSSEAA